MLMNSSQMLNLFKNISPIQMATLSFQRWIFKDAVQWSYEMLNDLTESDKFIVLMSTVIPDVKEMHDLLRCHLSGKLNLERIHIALPVACTFFRK